MSTATTSRAVAVVAHADDEPSNNGLPWPDLTVDCERTLMAVIRHGCVLTAAASLGITDRAAHGRLFRARAAMGGLSTLSACLAYQRFRLTGSAS